MSAQEETLEVANAEVTLGGLVVIHDGGRECLLVCLTLEDLLCVERQPIVQLSEKLAAHLRQCR